MTKRRVRIHKQGTESDSLFQSSHVTRERLPQETDGAYLARVLRSHTWPHNVISRLKDNRDFAQECSQRRFEPWEVDGASIAQITASALSACDSALSLIDEAAATKGALGSSKIGALVCDAMRSEYLNGVLVLAMHEAAILAARSAKRKRGRGSKSGGATRSSMAAEARQKTKDAWDADVATGRPDRGRQQRIALELNQSPSTTRDHLVALGLCARKKRERKPSVIR